jgi:hypothetical protein
MWPLNHEIKIRGVPKVRVGGAWDPIERLFSRLGLDWNNPASLRTLRRVGVQIVNGELVPVTLESFANKVAVGRKQICKALGIRYPGQDREEALERRDELLRDAAAALPPELSERVSWYDKEQGRAVMAWAGSVDAVHKGLSQYFAERWRSERTLSEPADPADAVWHAALSEIDGCPGRDAIGKILAKPRPKERKPREITYGDPQHANPGTVVELEAAMRATGLGWLHAPYFFANLRANSLNRYRKVSRAIAIGVGHVARPLTAKEKSRVAAIKREHPNAFAPLRPDINEMPKDDRPDVASDLGLRGGFAHGIEAEEKQHENERLSREQAQRDALRSELRLGAARHSVGRSRQGVGRREHNYSPGHDDFGSESTA